MWIKTMPDKPGRYFYRCTTDYSYGICLIAWTESFVMHGSVTESKLTVQSSSSWGNLKGEWSGLRGETAASPGWSYSFRDDPSTLEFWSEPVVVPPEFPEIPQNKPEPPAPERVEKSRAEYESDRKLREKEEKAQQKKERAAIKKAVSDGRTLYRCDGCMGFVDSDDLVTVKKRSCGNCDEEFFEEDGERNCPSCNRPFTRLEEEYDGCPGCEGSNGEPELTCLVKDGVKQDD